MEVKVWASSENSNYLSTHTRRSLSYKLDLNYLEFSRIEPTVWWDPKW